MRIVLLDKASLDCGDLNFSVFNSPGCELVTYNNTYPDNLYTRIKDADIVITNKVVIDASMLEKLSKLKLICIAATGTNNVDLVEAKKRNIIVCNVNGYATASVVQHVFMLITTLNTNLKRYQKALVDGKWSDSDFFCLLDYPISDLTNKTMGIIGYGELGKAVAKVAKAFAMNVIVAESLNNNTSDNVKRCSLDTLLAKSDIVSLHCPLTEKTSNLISDKELEMMKSSAILINTARGGIVNEAALLKALQNKSIAAAGIDVLKQEPPEKDNELLNAGLDNLVITPHIAWASQASRQLLLEGVAANIKAFMQGTAQNVVNN